MSEQTTITRADAVKLIQMSGGLIIGLEFVKRSTGELRQGSFRVGVVRLRGDLGSGRAYDPREHGLITVWDMHKNGYRSVPVEGLTRMAHRGRWLEVVDDAPAGNPLLADPIRTHTERRA